MEHASAAPSPPFDTNRLDALLDEAGVDLALATSRHNVRYLLGSYSRFHESFDAIGLDRNLPALGYPAGSPDSAFAVGADVDAGQHEVEPVWVATLLDASQSAVETARLVAGRLRALGLAHGTVALEQSFAPHRFVAELAAELPGLTLVEATPLLEELRAVKRTHELALLREAAELIVESIAATARAAAAGTTKQELTERLRVEEERRGLRFEYCLLAAGTSTNRAPSGQRLERGDIVSLDSGGQRHGYIGDLCRMAILGEPTAQHEELLAEVRAIQDAARAPIRAGAPGRAIYEAAGDALRGAAHASGCAFAAHGMGLIPHEAPRLSDSTPIRYPATHRERPLEAGMVLSIETELRVPEVGLVKLEDTVAVTADGCEGYGDAHRDWIVVPAAHSGRSGTVSPGSRPSSTARVSASGP